MCAAALMSVLGREAQSQITSGAPALPPILELRLASATPAPGFTTRHESPGGDQPKVLFLAPRSLVSDTDLVRARTSPAAEGIVVEIAVSDAAAARLREATGNNIGKYVATFARGRFGGAAVIMNAIPRGNTATVALTLTPAAADSVRSLVAARWPTPPR
jgi:preprotein translocase subunit SecD